MTIFQNFVNLTITILQIIKWIVKGKKKQSQNDHCMIMDVFNWIKISEAGKINFKCACAIIQQKQTKLLIIVFFFFAPSKDENVFCLVSRPSFSTLTISLSDIFTMKVGWTEGTSWTTGCTAASTLYLHLDMGECTDTFTWLKLAISQSSIHRFLFQLIQGWNLQMSILNLLLAEFWNLIAAMKNNVLIFPQTVPNLLLTITFFSSFCNVFPL